MQAESNTAAPSLEVVSPAVAQTKGPRATVVVLGLLCLMYGLTYIDCVNVSTLLGFGEGATFPIATRAMADWDRTGSWALPFIGSIGLLLLGSMLAFAMKPDRELDDARSALEPVAAE